MSEEQLIKNAILGDAMQELGEHLGDVGDAKGLELLKNVGIEIRNVSK